MKKLLPLGLVLATVLTGTQAHAASATWNTTAADGNWFSAGNDWSTGAGTNPGSTTGTTSTDTATFLSSNFTSISINNGTGTLNLSGITFGAATTALSSFTIGATNGKAIYLTGGGSSGISFLADTTPTNIVETINAPLLLGGATSFTNNNATASNVLAIGGSISSGTTSAVTLTLSGANSGTNTISGNISNGNSSALGVTKTTSGGEWILSGNNSYSGLTNASQGTLVLSGSNSGAGGVSVGNGATLNVNNANALGTGTFTIVGGSKFDNTSSGAITNLGNNAIALQGSTTFVGSNSLNLGTGSITQTALSTLTVNSNTLTLGGNITGAFNLTKSGTGALALSGNNSSLTGTVSLGSNTSTAAGTLDINSATALGTNTFIISGTGNSVIDNTSTGAVVNSNNNVQNWNASFTYGGTQNLNLGTGSVTLLSSVSSFTVTTNAGNLTVGGVIGSGSTATLIKAGSGTLTLAGANLYTGTTTLSAGTLILANSAVLNGGLAVNAGTTLDLQSTNAVNTTVTGSATISSDVTTNGSAGVTQTLGTLSIGAFTLNATAGSNVSGGTPAVAFGATTLSNGTGATTILNPTTAAITLTSVVGNQGSNETDTLDLDGTSTGTITGVIGNGAHGSLAVIKSNSSAWTLSGSNTYFGGTTVSGGNLDLTGSTSSSGTSTNVFTVGGVSGGLSTATLSGTGTIGGVLVTSSANSNVAHIAPGATAGTVGTLHLNSAGFTVGAGTQFDFDINTTLANSDSILMTGGTLTIGGSGIDFNFNQLSSLSTTGSYTLISGATSISGFNASDFSATGIGSDTATFTDVGNTLYVSFIAPSGSTSYYFTGSNSGSFTDAGNYYTLASGGSQQSGSLSSTSNVFLNATSPTPANTPDTLNTSASINSLNFVTAGTSLMGSGTLTLAATGTAGITDSAGTAGQTETVAPAVILGSSQSWVATANSTLNVTGTISGAQSLALTGSGTFKLGGANTFQGLTVGTGSDTPTLYLTNGSNGSATGTTTLSVKAGATLAGNGTSSGTSFNISGTGTATGARANVLVGLTSATDTLTTNVLTLKGSTGTSTIADANLTFNLDAKSTASTQLAVGATNIGFGTGSAGSVKFTLNLQDEPGIVAANTMYTLIAGTGSTSTTPGSSTGQYTGLTLGATTTVGSATETIITGNNLQLAFGSSLDQSYYGANSYLVLYQSSGVDDIDVVVVPEPGTWAMMLGGLALLVVVQRARRKNN